MAAADHPGGAPPAADRSGDAPLAPIRWLDTLWLQVAGTVCNLRCTHCFISCAPDNHRHEMMTLADVRRRVAEGARLGVREYYFTGGEPFMHRDLLTMIEETLDAGPVTVLTNGLFLTEETCDAIARLAAAAAYSLDIRVSLDGWGVEDHDAIRGPGTHHRAIEGIGRLHRAGVNPVITVTEAAEGVGAGEGRARFLALLRERGLDRPRLKVLPLWRIGAEAERTQGYGPEDRLVRDAVTPEGLESLQCASGRMVTSRGVYVCPLLIEEPEAHMGDAIEETLRPFPLRYGACVTCYVSGVTCRT